MNIRSKMRNMTIGVKASIVYTFASLLSKGMAIITVPIFTRLMSTEQMGIVNLFNSWQSMIGAIATLSLTSGGYMVAMHEYENRRDKYMSSVLTLTSVVALFIAGVYFISPGFWNNVTGLSTPLIILMIFGFFVSPATDFWLARQRYEYKYVLAGIVIASSTIIASIISVVAVIIASKTNIQHLGAIRLFSSYAITYCLALILWIYIMIKGKTFVKKEFWKFSLTLSVPLIGNSIAMQVLSVSDRMMISKMISNSAVGIYSILYTISSLSLIVWSAINSSFVPFLFENIEKKSQRKSIQKTATQLMIMYSVVAIAMTIIAPEIVKILATEEYYEAIYIMPPIAAGIFLTSISNMYSNIIIYYKKTKYIMISSILAATLNVILNYECIKIWGYMAAAYTTLFAYIVLAIIQCIVSKKIYSNNGNNTGDSIYEDRKLVILSIITIISCLLCLVLYTHTIIRYCVIIGLVIFTIVNKNKIMNFIQVK